MKKLNLITLLSCAIFNFISTSAFAKTTFEMAMIKYNPITGSIKKVKSRDYSLSKDTKSVCWQASGLQKNTKYHVKQTIISPPNDNFSIPDGIVIKNKNNTKNVMVSTNKTSNKGSIDMCWSFANGEDSTDDYSLKVKVNQDESPEFKFRLTK